MSQSKSTGSKGVVLGPLQREWVRCLESGDFPQGRRSLFTITEGVYKHCCLGVAVCVAEANGLKLNWVEEDGELYCKDDKSNLPAEVRNMLGFYDSLGTIKGKELKQCSNLEVANDDGVSFSQIAKFVRKYPEAVFKESK